jgi:hypothetical protein
MSRLSLDAKVVNNSHDPSNYSRQSTERNRGSKDADFTEGSNSYQSQKNASANFVQVG